MFFKNATIYQITKDMKIDFDDLESRLEEAQFEKCPASQLSSRGFFKPLGKKGTMFSHVAGQCVMICQKTEEKIIPSAAINARLEEKVDAIELTEDRKLSRKEKRELKEEIIFDMTPRALSKYNLLYAYFDFKNNWFVVNTSSGKKADEICNNVREIIGSFPVIPLTTKNQPIHSMTHWLVNIEAPTNFAFGSSCALQNLQEQSNSARFNNHDICSDEVNSFLKDGMTVQEIALEFKDIVSFTINDKLTIKKLSFSDRVIEAGANAEDAIDQFDADFHIMVAEIELLIYSVLSAFGGYSSLDVEEAEQTEMVGLNVSQIAESGDPINEYHRQAIEHILKTKDTTVNGLIEFLQCDRIVAVSLIEMLERIEVISAPNDEGVREIIQ